MGDSKQLGKDVYRQVVDVVGHPRVCKLVDSQTRTLVTQLLTQSAGGTPAAANAIGRDVASRVTHLCTSMTPEGRTVIVLTGSTAAIVYGVLNWDELEPKVQDALLKAQVPITVPIDRVGIPGDLKLGLGLEEFKASYRANAGLGQLDVQLKHELKTGGADISASWASPAYGGNFKTGVQYNTKSGDHAVFFEFRVKF